MSYAVDEVTTAPAWLRGTWGEAWHYVAGLIKDAFVEGAKQAVKARFAAIAPTDAEAALLADMGLDAPYNEVESTTRARLLGAFSTWQLAGTKAGVLAALRTAGYTNVEFQERYDPTRWWLFKVILRAPFPWDYATQPHTVRWGGGWVWGAATYTGIGPLNENHRVVAIVNKWKPAHSLLDYVFVELDGPRWGAFTWGDGTRYDVTADVWR